jgi:hypothetical protein
MHRIPSHLQVVSGSLQDEHHRSPPATSSPLVLVLGLCVLQTRLKARPVDVRTFASATTLHSGAA